MQEIDSLGFRNQQLSKRVIVLQDELEQSRRGGKKTKSGGGSSGLGVPPDVHAQELQSKIHENERLHKEIYEVSSVKDAMIDDLRRQLEALEKSTYFQTKMRNCAHSGL
eukprot:m.297744 g.297744  ORF g.297744 m.297744 type:complete len:109 (+) comp40775_c1_seq22:875-1201(+)